MIDENGRVGRRINIIDLTVVLLVLAGLAFYAYRGMRSTNAPGGATGLDKAVPTKTITVTLESEPVFPGVADELEPGTEIMIWNGSTNIPFGRVAVKPEVTPYPSRATDATGNLKVVPEPVTKLVRLVVTGPGAVGKNIVTMNNQVVMLNTRFTIRTPRSTFLVAVRDLQIADSTGGTK